MTLGYNRMLERHHLPGQPVEVWRRGGAPYDVTKEMLRIEAA